jgi:hypothetical protein
LLCAGADQRRRTDLSRSKREQAVRNVNRPITVAAIYRRMRDKEEIREQYEFLQEQLDSEDMNHESVRQMFTYYKRALGWALEEEHI